MCDSSRIVVEEVWECRMCGDRLPCRVQISREIQNGADEGSLFVLRCLCEKDNDLDVSNWRLVNSNFFDEASELGALAQLGPHEGIEDGVERIAKYLEELVAQK